MSIALRWKIRKSKTISAALRRHRRSDAHIATAQISVEPIVAPYIISKKCRQPFNKNKYAILMKMFISRATKSARSSKTCLSLRNTLAIAGVQRFKLTAKMLSKLTAKVAQIIGDYLLDYFVRTCNYFAGYAGRRI